MRMAPDQPEWQITLFIQNASELPVEVHVAELAIDTLGYQNVLASGDGEPPQLYADKRTGPVKPAYFFPGTIPPRYVSSQMRHRVLLFPKLPPGADAA